MNAGTGLLPIQKLLLIRVLVLLLELSCHVHFQYSICHTSLCITSPLSHSINLSFHTTLKWAYDTRVIYGSRSYRGLEIGWSVPTPVPEPTAFLSDRLPCLSRVWLSAERPLQAVHYGNSRIPLRQVSFLLSQIFYMDTLPLPPTPKASPDGASKPQPLHFVFLDGTWNNSTAMLVRLQQQAERVWGQKMACLCLTRGEPSKMHSLR
jgi:hypothetical protein